MKKILLSVLGLVLASCVVYAGDFSFVFNEKLFFDDNIYLTKNNKDSSLISATRLGVDFKSAIPQTTLDFNAGALLGYNYYFTDPSVNSCFDVLVNLGAKNENLNVENTFRYTEDPAESAFTERVARINNLTKIYFQTARYNLLSFGVGLVNSLDNYLDSYYDEVLSRNRLNFIANIYYEVFPRTDIYFDYTGSYTQYTTNEENNSFGSSIGLGVKGELASNMTANIKLCFDNRSYSNNRLFAGKESEETFGIFGYEALVKWEPLHNTSVVLSGHRRAEETQYELDRYYISTLFALQLKQKFYDTVGGSLLFSYEGLSYDQSERADNILKIRPAIEIETGNGAAVVIWYSYSDKTSDKSEVFEYSNNVIGADFRIKF